MFREPGKQQAAQKDTDRQYPPPPRHRPSQRVSGSRPSQTPGRQAQVDTRGRSRRDWAGSEEPGQRREPVLAPCLGNERSGPTGRLSSNPTGEEGRGGPREDCPTGVDLASARASRDFRETRLFASESPSPTGHPGPAGWREGSGAALSQGTSSGGSHLPAARQNQGSHAVFCLH